MILLLTPLIPLKNLVRCCVCGKESDTDTVLCQDHILVKYHDLYKAVRGEIDFSSGYSFSILTYEMQIILDKGLPYWIEFR